METEKKIYTQTQFLLFLSFLRCAIYFFSLTNSWYVFFSGQIFWYRSPLIPFSHRSFFAKNCYTAVKYLRKFIISFFRLFSALFAPRKTKKCMTSLLLVAGFVFMCFVFFFSLHLCDWLVYRPIESIKLQNETFSKTWTKIKTKENKRVFFSLSLSYFHCVYFFLSAFFFFLLNSLSYQHVFFSVFISMIKKKQNRCSCRLL